MRLGKLIIFAVLYLGQLNAVKLDADGYQGNSQVQFCWAITALYQLELNGDENILDVGCADGKITAELAKRSSGRIVGIDPNAEAIALAKDSYANIEWQHGSFEEADFTEPFDVITCFCTLNWIEDRPAFFEWANRSLKKGGRLLIVVPEPGPKGANLEPIKALLATEAWQPYLQYLGKPVPLLELGDYVHMAAMSGFAPLLAYGIPTPVVFNTVDELEQWHLAIRAELQQIPADLRREYFESIASLIRELYPQAGDGRLYSFPRRYDMLLTKIL